MYVDESGDEIWGVLSIYNDSGVLRRKWGALTGYRYMLDDKTPYFINIKLLPQTGVEKLTSMWIRASDLVSVQEMEKGDVQNAALNELVSAEGKQ